MSSLLSPRARCADARRTISGWHRAYREGALRPGDCVHALLRAWETADDNPVWIQKVAPEVLLRWAADADAQLAARGPAILEEQPLFGLIYAVKDNIDVAGLSTTAACPAYGYVAQAHAGAVARLEAAGALCVGKTNLDQFATGLVGTRSPYGVVRHPECAERIAGGSSSGSAVAVALGQVPFALGTDTAGSGRVPAGFTGIVGLKPSRGLVSNAGMVPACRSLDCVSVFAQDVADAWRVLGVIAGPDPLDPYTRQLEQAPVCSRRIVFGVPARREFFGDDAARAAFDAALKVLASLRFVELHPVDADQVLAAAELLYQGPWIAERRVALGDFFERHGKDMDPAVREIVAGADRYDAADAFRAQYRLAAHRAGAARLFASIDALLLPTAPMHPRLAEVLRDPIGLNTRLGLYTNFANLLDLAAIAIPAGRRADGLPSGVTLLAPAGADHRLASMGEVCARAFEATAAEDPLPAAAVASVAYQPLAPAVSVDLAVVGAHLSGQALNHQLLDCGARLLRACSTAPRYRLYALVDTQPAKPGLLRDSERGCAIELEVWRLPEALFGRFVAGVNAPMAIGSVELEDGSWVKGFVCEPWALAGATEISQHAGWRAYRATLDTEA